MGGLMPKSASRGHDYCRPTTPGSQAGRFSAPNLGDLHALPRHERTGRRLLGEALRLPFAFRRQASTMTSRSTTSATRPSTTGSSWTAAWRSTTRASATSREASSSRWPACSAIARAWRRSWRWRSPRRVSDGAEGSRARARGEASRPRGRAYALRLLRGPLLPRGPPLRGDAPAGGLRPAPASPPA